ncbi:MAG: DUF4333 domain-containing protein [Acidimicrobiales bacterium]|nr:DUF4333 domain-containing protein [Acidimicrobiales bacterium]
MTGASEQDDEPGSENRPVDHGDLLGFLSDFRIAAPQSETQPSETGQPARRKAPATAYEALDSTSASDQWSPPPAPPQPAWESPSPEQYSPPAAYPSPSSYPPSNSYPPPGTYPPPIAYSPPGAYPPPGQYPPQAPYPYQGQLPSGNTMAGVALGLGLGSLVIPLLSVPGLILGIKSLNRSKLQPWIGGRGRAIAGIVTSALLGPLMAIVLIVAVVNRIQHEDMGRVQALVSSMTKTQVQQVTGSTPNVSVQCPSSEPRKAGTTFSCTVTDLDNGRSIVVQVRETDNSGDVLVTPEAQTRSPN